MTKIKRLLTKLNKNDFSKEVITISSPIVRKKFDDSINKTNDNISKEEEYVLNVLRKMLDIYCTFEQLCYIPSFLSKYDEKFYKKRGINHQQYLSYHLESHYFKVIKINDQLCSLVSEVYYLGIPSKLAKLPFLRENKITKNTSSVEALKKFEKDLKEIRTERNIVAHSGKITDKKINEYDFYHSLGELLPNHKVDKKILKGLIRVLVKEKKDLIEKNNESVLQHVQLVFITLLVRFKSIANAS
ncbi:MAG: hypothetical protein JSS63_13485 [Bacteroidetes bacterium]|nr:hypothetical protein [Bacteroidota bacterium]